MVTFTYQIDYPWVVGAPEPPYSEVVRVSVESGNPGGEPGAFEADIKTFLESWFDGAKVKLL